MSRRDVRALAAIVVVAVVFAVSMRLRDVLNPWLLTTAAACVSIAVVLAARSRLMTQLGTWSARGAVASAGLGVALVVATHGAYRLAVALVPALALEVNSLYASIDVFPGPVRAAPLIVVVVLAEELAWRGLVVDWLSTRCGRPAVAMLSVASSAVPEIIGGSWVLVAAAIALGSVFVAQRLRSGRLTDPLITHVIWSLSVFSLVPL